MAGLLLPALLSLGSCGGGEPSQVSPQASPPSAAGRPGGTEGTGTFLGKVEEVLHSGGYTYVRVRKGTEEVWVAGPGKPPEKGERLAFLQGVPLENFHSKSLGRTFRKIYFVSRFRRASQVGKAPGKEANTEKKVRETRNPPGEIFTVAALRKDKAALEGRTVRVRGEVSKVNAGIMGRNWVHLVDPGAPAGAADLVFTTKDRVLEGRIVLVRGVVRLNKDFGYGYKYDLLIEEGVVEKEER